MTDATDARYHRFSDDDHEETSEDRPIHSEWNDANYSMPSQIDAKPITVLQSHQIHDHDQIAAESGHESSTSFKPPPLSRLRSGSLSSRALEFVASKMAAGSIKGSIFTMCICVVGAGCLALPYALRNVGLVLGPLLIAGCALLAYFTLDLLLISAEYLPEELRGPKPLRNISFQSLALHSYGPRLARALQYLMAVQYFGSFVGYVVAFSGFFDLVYSIYPHPDHWPDSIYTHCVVGICYGLILPLSLLRNIDSLRFTSLLGFSMAIYLVAVVTIEYFLLCSDTAVDEHYGGTTCLWSGEYSIPDRILWPLDSFEHSYSGFLTAFPLVLFSCTGHAFLLPLYVELARPTIRRMRKVFRRGMSIVFVLYIFIALFGFLLFLDAVCSNLLLNNFRRHFDVVIAAMGIALSCILTEPIFVYNFRRTIGMLVWNKTTNDITTFWHIAITVLFVTANVALGVAVKSIAVVFGFLGSTTYPLLGYILPAAFFFAKSRRAESIGRGKLWQWSRR